MFKNVAAASCVAALACCGLMAQGLETKASPHDWEEINFEFNSAILSDGYPSLLRLAELLGQHRDYHVQLTGYTDAVGSRRYNQKLAVRRGETVKAFLVKYGASADQISVTGEGKERPESSNGTKEGRFMNRRVHMRVTNGQGQVVGDGGIQQAIQAIQPSASLTCCDDILKRLDKLDDILAALRDMKGENDKLKSDLAKLQDQQQQLAAKVGGLPNKEETQQIAKEQGEATAAKTVQEAARHNHKFSLLGLNVGPTYGAGRTGDFTFSGRGQFFSPFGGSGTHAVQAQGEYMYYPGRQEGQFDIGLVNRWNQIQMGLFTSFKYLNFSQYQNGGALAQGAFTFDYLFSRGKLGLFGTKGFKNEAVLNRTVLAANTFLETYASIINQVGASGQIGLFGDSYLEGNIGYLQSHGQADRPGGMLRFVKPLNEHFALTAEAGLNETFLNTKQSGRVVFGFQLGNFIRPKEYLAVKSPVPVDIPRIRYETLTRRVGNAPPVADAGPNQTGAQAGTITLDGSGSYDPDGDTITFAWTQIAGPAVSLSGANTAKATFTAAAGQTYSFRLTVRDSAGLSATATTTVSTLKASPIRIASFTAQPSTIASGGHSTLNWLVDNADSVTISGVGSVDARSGSTDVSPTQTTQYTLTAHASGVPDVSATITVTVQSAVAGIRILRFDATPATIQKGQSSTLAWTTDGASRVDISGVGTVPVNGSTVVSPTETTTYTLTAFSGDGKTTVTAPVVVTVGNGQTPQVLQFTVSPSAISQGGSAQLCWNVQNATQISITPGIGSVKATDCTTVNPTTTTTYVLNASNAAGPIQASVTLAVGVVQISSFTSNPETSQKAGDPVTLSWTTQNAQYVTITGNGVTPGNLPASGSIVVNPITNSTYTLTAYGPGGQTVTSVLSVFVR